MFSVWQRPQIVWGGGDEAGGGGEGSKGRSKNEMKTQTKINAELDKKKPDQSRVSDLVAQRERDRAATARNTAGTKYTGLKDMFDGGGPGASGPQFRGGPLSGVTNPFGGGGGSSPSREAIPGPGTIAQRISGSFAGTDSLHRPASNFKTINNSQRRALEAAGYSVTKQGTVKSRDGSATVAGSRWSRSNVVNQIMAENAEDRRSGGGDRVPVAPKKVVRPKLRPDNFPKPAAAPIVDYDRLAEQYGAYGAGRASPQAANFYTDPSASTAAVYPQAPDFSQQGLPPGSYEVASSGNAFEKFLNSVGLLEDKNTGEVSTTYNPTEGPIGTLLPDMGSDPSDNREPRGMYAADTTAAQENFRQKLRSYQLEPFGGRGPVIPDTTAPAPKALTYNEILESIGDTSLQTGKPAEPLTDIERYDKSGQLKPGFSTALQARIEDPTQDLIEAARERSRDDALRSLQIGLDPNVSRALDRVTAARPDRDPKTQAILDSNEARFLKQSEGPSQGGEYAKVLVANALKGLGLTAEGSGDQANFLAPRETTMDPIAKRLYGGTPRGDIPTLVGDKNVVSREADRFADTTDRLYERIMGSLKQDTRDALEGEIFKDQNLTAPNVKNLKMQAIAQLGTLSPIIASMAAGPLAVLTGSGMTVGDVNAQTEEYVRARYDEAKKSGAALGNITPAQLEFLIESAQRKATVPASVVGGATAGLLKYAPGSGGAIMSAFGEVLSEVGLEPSIAELSTAKTVSDVDPMTTFYDEINTRNLYARRPADATLLAAGSGLGINVAAGPPTNRANIPTKAADGLGSLPTFDQSSIIQGGPYANKPFEVSGATPGNIKTIGTPDPVQAATKAAGAAVVPQPTNVQYDQYGRMISQTAPQAPPTDPISSEKSELQAAAVKQTGEAKAEPNIIDTVAEGSGDAQIPLTPEQIANVSTDAGAELDAALDVAPITAEDAAPTQIDKNGASRPENVSAAIDVMKRDGRSTIYPTFLQRKLRINYSEAEAINEQLEAEGYVSAPDHIGARKILTTDPTTAAEELISETAPTVNLADVAANKGTALQGAAAEVDNFGGETDNNRHDYMIGSTVVKGEVVGAKPNALGGKSGSQVYGDVVRSLQGKDTITRGEIMDMLPTMSDEHAGQVIYALQRIANPPAGVITGGKDGVYQVSQSAVAKEIGVPYENPNKIVMRTPTSENRALQILQKARVQQNKGNNQLISKADAKYLEAAGLLEQGASNLAIASNQSVADLLAQGPEAVKAKLAALTDQQLIDTVGGKPKSLSAAVGRNVVTDAILRKNPNYLPFGYDFNLGSDLDTRLQDIAFEQAEANRAAGNPELGATDADAGVVPKGETQGELLLGDMGSTRQYSIRDADGNIRDAFIPSRFAPTAKGQYTGEQIAEQMNRERLARQERAAGRTAGVEAIEASDAALLSGLPVDPTGIGSLRNFPSSIPLVNSPAAQADRRRAIANRLKTEAEAEAMAPLNRAQAALDAVVDPVPAAIQSIEAQRAEMLAANKTYQDYINTRAQISALDGVTKEQAEREAFAAVKQRIEDQQQQLLNAVNAEGGTAAITNAAENEIAKLQAQLNAVKEVIVNGRTPFPVNLPATPEFTTPQTKAQLAAITTPVETAAMAPLVQAASPEAGGGADIDIAGSEFAQAGPDTTEAPATLREFIEQQSMSPGSDTVAPIENVAEAAPAATNTQASSAVEINPVQNPELVGGVASLYTPSLEQQNIKSIIESAPTGVDPTVDVGRQLKQDDLIDALEEAQQTEQGVMSLTEPDLVPAENLPTTGGITNARKGAGKVLDPALVRDTVPKEDYTSPLDPLVLTRQRIKSAPASAQAPFFSDIETDVDLKAPTKDKTPRGIPAALKTKTRAKAKAKAKAAITPAMAATITVPDIGELGVAGDDDDTSATSSYFPELPTDDVLSPQDSDGTGTGDGDGTGTGDGDGTGTGDGTAVDGRPYVVPPMLTVDGEDGGCPSGYQRTLNPSTGRYLCIRLEPGTVGAPSAPVEEAEAEEDEDGVVIDIPITERPTISPYYVPEMVESNYTPYVPGRR